MAMHNTTYYTNVRTHDDEQQQFTVVNKFYMSVFLYVSTDWHAITLPLI